MVHDVSFGVHPIRTVFGSKLCQKIGPAVAFLFLVVSVDFSANMLQTDQHYPDPPKFKLTKKRSPKKNRDSRVDFAQEFDHQPVAQQVRMEKRNLPDDGEIRDGGILRCNHAVPVAS